MGTVLLAAGQKGHRYALPNSTIHMHQPLGRTEGQATDMEIDVQHILRQKKRLNQILSERTGQPLERIDLDTNRDYYMDAPEAVTYGLIDEVLVGPEKGDGKAKEKK
jgi:ATP-dependent Clp protease protease subunit